MYEKTIKHDGKYITVVVDIEDCPFHPRTDSDNLGVLSMTHKRYKFPNEARIDFNQFMSWDEVRKELDQTYGLIFPVYIHEHGEVAFSIEPFNCSWDSGQVGYICFDSEDLSRTLSSPEKIAKQELQEYEYFVNGECYRAVIYEGAYMDKEEIDSFDNYFGSPSESGILFDIRSALIRVYGEEAADKFDFLEVL
jgi:hypothetical protein